eukprot:gene10923-biopygen13237
MRAVALLRDVATDIGLDSEIVEPVKGKPILRCTLPGSDPLLPSLLINSHYDVVPSFPDKWHSDPFEARETDCGDIYARV